MRPYSLTTCTFVIAMMLNNRKPFLKVKENLEVEEELKQVVAHCELSYTTVGHSIFEGCNIHEFCDLAYTSENYFRGK